MLTGHAVFVSENAFKNSRNQTFLRGTCFKIYVIYVAMVVVVVGGFGAGGGGGGGGGSF